MKSKVLVLLVEDDGSIANFITAALEMKEYQVIRASNSEEGVRLSASRCPDLVILDLGLPDRDGVEVIRSIREWSDLPIVVVSARSEEKEKVRALDLGADDYLTKPFGTEELLARIRNAFRHHARAGAKGPLRILDLEIDVDRREVLLKGDLIHLTPIEYRLILLLAENAGKVLTIPFLIRSVWGPYQADANILRVNMANIRRKLEENPAEPKYIRTEVGVGYRMIEPK